jgi:hypothetical protein
LKIQSDATLSNFAVNFDLRRYTKGAAHLVLWLDCDREARP